ncbi:MAG: amidohydrolase, partial [Pseudomonadota bacterium]
ETLTTFSELLLDGEHVVATGTGELAGKHPDATRVDGRGRTVVPGLIDAHGHVSGLGFAAERVDLVDVPSLSAATNAVAAFAAANPDTAWVLGRGWNQVLWDGDGFPTAADLDAAVPDRPVWLRRIDGHAGWANTAALAAAGIDETTATPTGGRILTDADGRPSGVLIDAAMQLVEAVIPPPGDADLERVISAALARLASRGVTSVHDAGVPIAETRVYRRLAGRGAMPVRVYAMLAGAGRHLDAFGEPLHDAGGGFLTIAGVKLYADGALGSRGAALLADYSDEPGNRGLLFADTAALAADIRKSNAAGFQAAVHAIGDAANKVVLDAFERAQGDDAGALRNRIEHAQIVRREDLERFAALEVIASMQPIHATSDKNMAEDRVGPTRILGGYAWRSMLAAGAVVAAGSDFPVEPENPLFGLHAAVTRKDRGGQPDGGWYPDEALTREQALRAFTYHAAYAARQEGWLGQLAAGMKADFVVLDRDFFTADADDLWRIRVLETWVNGKRVFTAAAERNDAD